MEETPPAAADPPPAGEPQAKKRKTKELPHWLSRLTEKTFRHAMTFRRETDPNEAGEPLVAFKASLVVGEGDEAETRSIELNTLTLDQLRRLCRNVGVQYVNQHSKFQCRKALSIHASFQEKTEKEGIELSTVGERADSNIIRLVNVIFSHNFFETFLKLNDIKKRVDHETGSMPNNFWDDVAETLNGASEDDESPLLIVVKPTDRHYDELMDVNLNEFDLTTGIALRKKFNLLLKVRKLILKNMQGTSGENDNDPYNFVENAMKKTTGANSNLTHIGVYYFFMRCAAKKEVDETFCDTMDESLRGSTNSPLVILDDASIGMNSTTPPSSVGGRKNLDSKKVEAYAAIVDMSHSATSIAQAMRQTNILAKESIRLAEQSQLIMVAQHLGKSDLLEDLLSNHLVARGGGGGHGEGGP